MKKRFVVDTSIIIDGEITKMLESGEIIDGNSEIIIPIAVVDELQSQASTNKEHGFVGLDEVKKIREHCTTKGTNLEFEKYFDEDTMSVHLKEGVQPMAKRGKPGNFELVRLSAQTTSQTDLTNIIKEISEASRVSPEGNVEISLNGATVIQYGGFRIAITRPPFSDGIE